MSDQLLAARIQRLLWWWRLRAVFSLGWQALVALLVVSPLVIVVMIIIQALAAAGSRPFLGLSALLLALVIVTPLAALYYVLSGVRTLRLKRLLEMRRELGTVDPVARPKEWEVPALFLNPEHRSGEGLEGLLKYALAGVSVALERLIALSSLGGRAAVAILAELARRSGPLPLYDIVALLGPEADVERVILGVANINGVFLMLDDEPARLVMASGLRRRLSAAT